MESSIAHNSEYLLASIIMLLTLFLFIGIPRIKMELRAKRILSQMPNHEITSSLVIFHSASPSQKRVVINEKIAEMESNGWLFLKSAEANPLKTILYWGGGLKLYFIKNKRNDS